MVVAFGLGAGQIGEAGHPQQSHAIGQPQQPQRCGLAGAVWLAGDSVQHDPPQIFADLMAQRIGSRPLRCDLHTQAHGGPERFVQHQPYHPAEPPANGSGGVIVRMSNRVFRRRDGRVRIAVMILDLSSK